MTEKICKFLPCARYDVERLESFFNDMSKEGFNIQKSGIFLNIVYFEKSNQRYYYHLVPRIRKDKDETNFMLQQEEKGYLYMDTIGEFYIYAYTKPFEIVTDQKSYKKLKNNAITSFFGGLFTILLFLIFDIQMTFMLFVISLGTILSMVMLMLFIGWTIGKLDQYFIYKNLYNKFTQQQKREEKEWQYIKSIYPAYQFIKIILVVLVAISVFTRLDVDAQDLPTDISGIPFATLSDFETDELSYTRETNFFGNVKTFSDILSPINYEWEETGNYNSEIATKRASFAILDANYHETIHPLIASQLVKEYTFRNLHHDYYAYVELNVDAKAYGVDELRVLGNSYHCVYILRLDNKVLCFDLSWDDSHHQIENIIPILKDTLEC